MGVVLAWAGALLILPLLYVIVDTVGALRGKHRRPAVVLGHRPSNDFTVLVPIYGDVRYLENVEYLAGCGAPVILCTTDAETPHFYAELSAIAARHDFSLVCVSVPQPRQEHSGRRATSGTIRDRVIREALHQVRTRTVVCIDADTTTTRPLSELVGDFEANDLDFASIRVVPSNTSTILGKLQWFEYRVAMKMRLVAPWMVSGACHVARTSVHRRVMDRHSLFFQGNDVEAGVLASALGHRVGHIPFEVPTRVPDRLKPFLRQRLAWSGGEFRLFAVNFRLIRRHPFMWAYGAVVTLLGLPLRWASLGSSTATLLTLGLVACVYLAFCLYMHGRHWSWHLLIYPLYTGFLSLVMTPLGAFWYVYMAIKDRNAGIIRTREPAPRVPAQPTAHHRPPATAARH